MYHQDPEAAQTILDSVNDGVFTVDREWRITSFNKAAERITGVSHDEALGARCCDVFRASICETECALRQTIESGTPVVNKGVYIVDATGRQIPISISTAILEDDNGDLIGGVETFRDLSLVEELRSELERSYSFVDIIGRSPAMRELFAVLARVATSDIPVLIQGETGTGKEVLARSLHRASARAEQPFVVVDCAAMPHTLIEAELFGHLRGAFTGATESRAGAFESADGGTVLLDEIGELPLALQPKLLRALEARRIKRLGDTRERPVDVRFMAATHRDLLRMASEGTFREDLYFRIAVLPIKVPPLRQRAEDIPLLVEHFLPGGVALPGDVLAELARRPWLGNVRELRNAVERMLALGPGALDDDGPVAPTPTEGLPPVPLDRPFKQVRQVWTDHLERVYIAGMLQRHGRSLARIAEASGLDRSYVHRLMRKHDL